MLKAITLYEPFATLMRIGAKQNETRGQRTNHRGDIAIHAALSRDGASDEVMEAALDAFKFRKIKPELHFGKIVAVVELYDVQPSEKFFRPYIYPPVMNKNFIKRGYIKICEEEWAFGNYSDGRFIYRTRNLRPLREPVAAKGLQCVGWTVPADIEAKVRVQI